MFLLIIEGLTWNISDFENFGNVPLIVIFSLASPLVVLIIALLNLITFRWAPNRPFMLFSTKDYVDPVSEIAFVLIKVLPLEEVIGIFCKLSQQVFAVSTVPFLFLSHCCSWFHIGFLISPHRYGSRFSDVCHSRMFNRLYTGQSNVQTHTGKTQIAFLDNIVAFRQKFCIVLNAFHCYVLSSPCFTGYCVFCLRNRFNLGTRTCVLRLISCDVGSTLVTSRFKLQTHLFQRVRQVFEPTTEIFQSWMEMLYEV